MRSSLTVAVLAGAVLVALAPPAAGRPSVVRVSNAEELAAAVASASAGDEILLAAGDYAPAAPLELKKNVTIAGPTGSKGARLLGTNVAWIAENPPDLVVVASGVEATIRNIAVTTVDIQGSALLSYGKLTLENVEVTGNNGLAVYIQPSGTLRMVNSTVSDNSSDGVIVDGSAELVSSTIASNLGGGVANATGLVTLKNTIVSGNRLGDCTRPVAVSSSSLDQDGTCSANLRADPLLDPLGRNGGPTLTRALRAGSPAIGAGSGCPPNDQRLAPRSSCDLGAFQTGTSPPADPPAAGGGGGGSGGGGGRGGGGGDAGPGGGAPQPPGAGDDDGPERVTGRGVLRTSKGRASFRIVATEGQRRAVVVYVDSAAGLRLRSTRISSATVDIARRVATVRGSWTHPKTGRRLRVTFVATDASADRLRVSISNGYRRSGRVVSGGIVVAPITSDKVRSSRGVGLVNSSGAR